MYNFPKLNMFGEENKIHSNKDIVVGINGATYEVGKRYYFYIPRLNDLESIVRVGKVISLATKKDFLCAHPIYERYPELLFENYYWVEVYEH